MNHTPHRLAAWLVAVACLWWLPVSARGVVEFPVSWSAPDRVVVPMKMRSGVPTIPCSVNGREVWMILDTGSQRSVLEGETAAKTGVRTIEHSRAKVEVTGTRGQETALVGVIDEISIGAWRSRGLPCVVRTAPGNSKAGGWLSKPPIAFNILGMDALGAMCSFVTFDYVRGEVVFGFRKAFRPNNSAAGTPSFLALRDGLPFVRVAHAGGEWSAVLDTGASSAMEIDRATKGQFGVRWPTRWLEGRHYGLGGAAHGTRSRFECAVLPSATCLGRSWRNIEAMIVGDASKIGSGLLRSARLTLDFKNSRLWLETPASRAR